MKVKNSEIVNVGEVSTRGVLRLDSMFNIFQEMAVLHTHKVGLELNDLLNSGKTWVLNRFVVQISELPRLEESIDIYTWSRKIYRFKGLREYEIHSKGIPVILASSLWVYMDIVKGRPVRVPEEYEDCYGVVKEQATGVEVEDIQFSEISEPEYSLKIATRVSDFDINGHVNNAVILQYIETGITRFFGGNCLVENISLIFMKEIRANVVEIYVDLQKTESGCIFEVRGSSIVFARGTTSIRQSASV